jgi:hypothetical protein
MHSKSHPRSRRVAAWTTSELSPRHGATVSPLLLASRPSGRMTIAPPDGPRRPSARPSRTRYVIPAAGTFVLAFRPVAALARPADSLHAQLSPSRSADRTGGGHDGA